MAVAGAILEANVKCLNMILATLCYIKRDDKTLMAHRNKKPNDIHEGKWNGLGGKFESGESPEECAIREVQGGTNQIHEEES